MKTLEKKVAELEKKVLTADTPFIAFVDVREGRALEHYKHGKGIKCVTIPIESREAYTASSKARLILVDSIPDTDD